MAPMIMVPWSLVCSFIVLSVERVGRDEGARITSEERRNQKRRDGNIASLHAHASHVVFLYGVGYFGCKSDRHGQLFMMSVREFLGLPGTATVLVIRRLDFHCKQRGQLTLCCTPRLTFPRGSER
eukprot:1793023-Pyramimonas_sp.AAC.1